MKLNWKILLTVLLTITLVFFLLKNSPDWLIYSLASLLALLGIWQVSQVKAILQGQLSDTRQQDTPSKRSYWLKRLGIFSFIVILGVLAEAVWWTKSTNLPLPLTYALKKPLWQLGITPLPTLIEIPKDKFQMGSDQYDREKPVHEVTFTQSFLMSQTEVTFEQYDYYIWDLLQQGISNISYLDTENTEASKKISHPDDESWGRDKRPVINISWDEAQAYTHWLSKQKNLQCRLPSEAEWEYAARAGTNTVYWWGDKADHNYANYGKDECCEGLAKGKDQWENTAPVGSFKANAFGLQDMHGNVYEWVQDCYQETYKNAPNDGTSWKKKECGRRVLRGGSWDYTPYGLRSAGRDYNSPDGRIDGIGFRVVCSLPSAEN